jgi:hypothetical protein
MAVHLGLAQIIGNSFQPPNLTVGGNVVGTVACQRC